MFRVFGRTWDVKFEVPGSGTGGFSNEGFEVQGICRLACKVWASGLDLQTLCA